MPHRDSSYAYPRAGAQGSEPAARMIAELCEAMAAQGLPLGAIGPTLVRGFAKFYRRLPMAAPGVDKGQIPLLYSMLGSGTTPLKMSKEDAAYQGRPVAAQRCGNCSSIYTNNATGDTICSQVEGTINGGSWCRLWNTDRF